MRRVPTVDAPEQAAPVPVHRPVNRYSGTCLNTVGTCTADAARPEQRTRADAAGPQWQRG